MDMIELLKLMLIVQVFFGFSITILVYVLTPFGVVTEMAAFNSYADRLPMQNITAKLEGSVQSQTNVPVVELGALVFYSGNIVIDLLLNFIFAVPEMITLVIAGIGLLVNVDPYMISVFKGFVGVLFTVLYFVAILQMITNIRSGGRVV
jgi:hypothetical protein